MTALASTSALDDHPDEAEIAAVGEGFLALTYPGDRFHHREHLIVSTYLLVRYPATDWRQELPHRIRAYNVAQGGVNDDTRGYHHTITMAYLSLIEQAMAMAGSDTLEAACRTVLASPAADAKVLLRFYSRDRLFSCKARAAWLEPDLAPIELFAGKAVEPMSTGSAQASSTAQQWPASPGLARGEPS